MSLYNLPSNIWQLFEEGQPEYRMDTDEAMDNRQAMQEFLYKLQIGNENILEDNGTQVVLIHGNYDYKIVVDCGGLGDSFSHKFTISQD